MSKYIFEKFKQINLESSFPNLLFLVPLHQEGASFCSPLLHRIQSSCLCLWSELDAGDADFCHSSYNVILCHFNARITFPEYDSSLVTGF